MTAESAVFARSWQVGQDYRVTLTVPQPVAGQAACAAIEWAPKKPTRLRTAEIHAYRVGRDAALREFAEATGLRVGLIEATR